VRQARPDAPFLELVHRLDRDTSGVLLLAKKRSALVDLHAQMREGRVDKRYLVLVRGAWRDALRRIELPLLSETRSDEKRVRVAASGKAAATVVRRERVWRERVPPVSLLEAELETGRTHQIRVHLAHLGYPLAGDDKYGDFAWNRALAREGLKRMFLHACRVTFVHPRQAVSMTLEAPLASDLVRFVTRLDTDAPGVAAGAAP
jgi:23S rRNA pseudouridine955/2504/2580 synthase